MSHPKLWFPLPKFKVTTAIGVSTKLKMVEVDLIKFAHKILVQIIKVKVTFKCHTL